MHNFVPQTLFIFAKTTHFGDFYVIFHQSSGLLGCHTARLWLKWYVNTGSLREIWLIVQKFRKKWHGIIRFSAISQFLGKFLLTFSTNQVLIVTYVPPLHSPGSLLLIEVLFGALFGASLSSLSVPQYGISVVFCDFRAECGLFWCGFCFSARSHWQLLHKYGIKWLPRWQCTATDHFRYRYRTSTCTSTGTMPAIRVTLSYPCYESPFANSIMRGQQ